MKAIRHGTFALAAAAAFFVAVGASATQHVTTAQAQPPKESCSDFVCRSECVECGGEYKRSPNGVWECYCCC